MPMPPWSEIWDALRLLIAPALGMSLFVMFVGRYLAPGRLSILVPALALAAGVIAGNYFREAMTWQIDSDRPLNERDMRTALGWSLEGKPAVEPSDAESDLKKDELTIPPARYWLPWLAGLAILIDMLVCVLPASPSLGWVLRTMAALLAGRLLTPADLRVDSPWVSWALGLSIVVEWAILQFLARLWKDGTVAAALSLCLAAAGVIILHAHSARLTDMALLFAVALLAIALMAWRRPVDTSAALSAAAVFLPGLLLNAQQETFSDVPWRSFLLAALAPVALLPMLHSSLARQTRLNRWFLAIILPLIPAAYAVFLAAQAEKMQF